MDSVPEYSRQQLITALQNEYEYLIHDDFDPDVDKSPDENLEWLQSLSLDALRAEVAEMVEADDSNQDEGDMVTVADYMNRWL